MIERIIDFSAKNRFLILILFVAVAAWGIWAVVHTPLDAIPDLSENQVIVYTEWMGRSPKLVEDQVTFPLVTALQGVPDVQAIRAQSMFGMSFVYIIFNESTDLYWARIACTSGTPCNAVTSGNVTWSSTSFGERPIHSVYTMT